MNDKTFLVGADDQLEDLLPWWYANVRKHNPNIDVTVADFGMTDSGRFWAERHANKVLTYEKHPKLAWFYKPTAMIDCPYEYTCWLDIDCEVLKPVDEIFNYPTDDQMALTQDEVRMGYPVKFGGAENWWATGVNVVKGKPQILLDWARNTLHNNDLRGDQEVLHQMIKEKPEYNDMIIKMPLEYQWLRILVQERKYDSADKKIMHWTGPVGKAYIRAELMPLAGFLP